MRGFERIRRWAAKALAAAFGVSRSRIGAQCQFDSGEMLRFNETVKPRAVLVINVTKREFLEQLSDAMIIYRHYPDREWADDPERRAAEHVERLAGEIAPVRDLVKAVVDGNEYVHAHQRDLHPLADRYMAKFIELCHTRLGKIPVVLNASTGNFGDDIAGCFPRMLEALREWGGYIGWHEYDWPDMWRAHEQGIAEGNEGMWHCLRWKRAARAIRAAMGGWCPQFVVTECGLDSHANPETASGRHRGFRDVHPDDLARSVEHYVKSLRWYYDRFDDDVFAAVVFGCGMVSPWQPFDIADTDVPDGIASFPPEPEPEPGPEPEPNGGDEMDLSEIKVFALDEGGQIVELTDPEKKEAVVTGKYGVEFRRAEVAEGRKVYRLAELWEKSGPASLVTNVRDEDGQPMPDADVAFYWPDAPDPPEPATEVYPHDWHRNFVHGATNENGDVGPGMGPGAYHGRGEGGPHAVWVRDPGVPSDICEKLGMLAGTPHDHLDQKFKLTTAGGNGDGDGNGDGNGELEIKEYLEQDWPSNMLYIAWPSELGVDADVHAASPGNPDHDTTPLEGWDYNGKRYALGGVCADFEGEEPRLYRIWAYRLPDPNDKITPVAERQFPPLNGKMSKVVCVVDYKEEESEPEPGQAEEITVTVEAGERLSALLERLVEALSAKTVARG